MKKKRAEKNFINHDNSKAAVHLISPLDKWLLHYGCPAILASLIGLFYFPSLRYSFQFDDLASITRYFNIRNNTFGDLFFHSPRWISYWINSVHYKIGKFNPIGYRLFNVCLHILTTILIFYFLYKALSRLKESSFFKEHALSIAFTAAALFGLHPVQTQTVSYVIQGQLEGLASFFMIASSLCFLLIFQLKDFFKKFLLGCLLFFIVITGCGSKEIFIVIPFLLMAVDWFFVAQGDWPSFKSRFWLHGLIIFVVFFVYLLLLKPDFFGRLIGLKLKAHNNIGNMLTEKRSDEILPIPFLISQFKVVLHYLWMFVWPFNICIEYDWKLSKNFFAYDCIVPFILLCGLFAGMIALLMRNKIHVLAFALIWFFIVIFPRSSIIPSSELLTDYKTYGGSMGIMLIFASAIVWLFSRLAINDEQIPLVKNMRILRFAMTVLILIPVGYFTFERNKVWRSGEEFWKNVIANAPGKARAYNNYAVALSEKQLYKESIPYYLKAIEMDAYYPDPLNNVAVAYAMSGDIDMGIAYLQKSIKMQPNYPEGYNNLASFLMQKKEFDKAEEMLVIALKLRKHYGKAFFNLGKLRLFQNKPEQAFEAFKNCCTKADLDNDANAFTLYARLAMSLKKYEDAVFAYRKLLELQPNFENVFQLSNAYFLNNDYHRALQFYQKAHQLKPSEARVVFNLGETFEKLGDVQQALSWFKKAQEMESPMPQLPLRIAQCLQKLQRDKEAQDILQELLSNKDLPEPIKVAAQKTLNSRA